MAIPDEITIALDSAFANTVTDTIVIANVCANTVATSIPPWSVASSCFDATLSSSSSLILLSYRNHRYCHIIAVDVVVLASPLLRTPDYQVQTRIVLLSVRSVAGPFNTNCPFITTQRARGCS